MLLRYLSSLLALLLMAGVACAQSAVPTVQVTPTATAYVLGNCLGNAGASAVLSVSGAIAASSSGGTLLSTLSVADSSGQDAPIDFLAFRKKPVGTYTDHAACSIDARDLPYVLGPFSVSGYKTYGTPGLATISGLAQPLNNTANGFPPSNTFWVVPVVQGTPTYGTATLTFSFGVVADGAGH